VSYIKNCLCIIINIIIYLIAYIIIHKVVDWHFYSILNTIIYPVCIYIISAILMILYLIFLERKNKIVSFLIIVNIIIVIILFLFLFYMVI
jgi:hypothetical protein